MSSVVGDVELMSLADVILWIAGRAMTGTLSVRRRGVEAKFTIRAGRCARAASLDPREYLGQHLINFGYINEAQLQLAFDAQRETNVPLGRVLMMGGSVTHEQLQRVLTFKIREGLLEALCWNEGQWRLINDCDSERELKCDLPVDLREVYSEGVARMQMWGEIRRVFPSDATRVDVLVDPALEMSDFDCGLLQMMHAGRSIGEAALELRAMDFQVYARLYELLNRHMIRPKMITEQERILGAPSSVTVPWLASPSATLSLHAREIAPPTAVALGQLALVSLAEPTLPREEARPRLVTPVLEPFPQVPNRASFSPQLVQARAAEPQADAPPFPVAAESQREVISAPSEGSSPQGNDVGAGSYMMMKSEEIAGAGDVASPPENTDPEHALRLALAGQDWSQALLWAQRILERDPRHAEALAADRLAEVRLRRRASSSVEADFDRVPSLAVAREAIAMGHLSSKERYILSRVDSKRTLGQIAAVSPVQRADLTRIIEAFMQRGIITLA